MESHLRASPFPAPAVGRYGLACAHRYGLPCAHRSPVPAVATSIPMHRTLTRYACDPDAGLLTLDRFATQRIASTHFASVMLTHTSSNAFVMLT